MVEICGETNVFGEDVKFTCTLRKGHWGFHSDSAVYEGKSWWSFRWGNVNDIATQEESD